MGLQETTGNSITFLWFRSYFLTSRRAEEQTNLHFSLLYWSSIVRPIFFLKITKVPSNSSAQIVLPIPSVIMMLNWLGFQKIFSPVFFESATLKLASWLLIVLLNPSMVPNSINKFHSVLAKDFTLLLLSSIIMISILAIILGVVVI